MSELPKKIMKLHFFNGFDLYGLCAGATCFTRKINGHQSGMNGALWSYLVSFSSVLSCLIAGKAHKNASDTIARNVRGYGHIGNSSDHDLGVQVEEEEIV